ncbi:MAG: nucleotidyl transferase AbiEii/AbiGii toxin family protein [Bacteroidales bacterium]|nr:nucleotidyl transferase AbiEii/AbiGii toxin family protein [Bacteroidales bacterium]
MEKELKNRQAASVKDRKRLVKDKIKANGGFWSYQGIPEHLDDDAIIGEIKSVFSDAREEILGSDHFMVFINGGRVKLYFFRPENPVKTMNVGLRYNHLKTPTLQELLGMKVYALCVRSVFRDYYDIYSLLENGMKVEDAVSYASYLSRHQIRSKTMYSRLLSPQLFRKDEDFRGMSPRWNVTAEAIRDRIKQALEEECLLR